MIHSPSQCAFSQHQCGILPFNVLLPLNQLDSSSQPTSFFLSTNSASFPQPTSSLLSTNLLLSLNQRTSFLSTNLLPLNQRISFFSTNVLLPLNQSASFPHQASFLSPNQPPPSSHPPCLIPLISAEYFHDVTQLKSLRQRPIKIFVFAKSTSILGSKRLCWSAFSFFFLFFHAVNSLRDQKGRECGVCQIFLFSLCRLKNVLLIVKRNIQECVF